MSSDSPENATAEPDQSQASDEPVIVKRQAMVDGRGRLAAYDIHLELAEPEAAMAAGAALRALAAGLNQVLSSTNFETLLGQYPGYLHLDMRVLTSGMIEVLPPRKIVIAISGALDASGVSLKRIQELHTRGHWIAMHFHELDENQLRAVLPFLKTLMIDFERDVPQRTVDSLLGLASRIGLQARGVTTESRYKDLARAGIDLFQGFYFAPETKVDLRSTPNPAKAQLLRLLTLILEDADNSDLVDEIKRNPTLSFNLLRLVNSAASGNLRSISSVQQAIVLMGRRQLQRWLNLMLFAGNNANDQNPLLQVAAGRARLMELMVEARPQSTQDERDQAFVTGVLSLVHMLLNTTPEAALQAIPLQPEIKAALVSREGRLGNLLALAESLEGEDASRTQSLWALVSYVPMKRMLDLQLEAFKWARSLEREATRE